MMIMVTCPACEGAGCLDIGCRDGLLAARL
jgi:hypothetical protein